MNLQHREKIRRQKFVFPKWKGSHIVMLENECSDISSFLKSEKCLVVCFSFKLTIRPPEIKELLVFFNRVVSLDILRDICSLERGSECKGTIQTPFSSTPPQQAAAPLQECPEPGTCVATLQPVWFVALGAPGNIRAEKRNPSPPGLGQPANASALSNKLLIWPCNKQLLTAACCNPGKQHMWGWAGGAAIKTFASSKFWLPHHRQTCCLSKQSPPLGNVNREVESSVRACGACECRRVPPEGRIRSCSSTAHLAAPACVPRAEACYVQAGVLTCLCAVPLPHAIQMYCCPNCDGTSFLGYLVCPKSIHSSVAFSDASLPPSSKDCLWRMSTWKEGRLGPLGRK